MNAKQYREQRDAARVEVTLLKAQVEELQADVRSEKARANAIRSAAEVLLEMPPDPHPDIEGEALAHEVLTRG